MDTIGTKVFIAFLSVIALAGLGSCGLVNPNHNGGGASIPSAAIRPLPADLEEDDNDFPLAGTPVTPADAVRQQEDKRRLPTLREYMRRLEERQDTMQQDLRDVKSDVAALREEMELLKTAVLNTSPPTTGSTPRNSNASSPQVKEVAPTSQPVSRLKPDNAASSTAPPAAPKEQKTTQANNSKTLAADPPKSAPAATSLKPDPPKTEAKKEETPPPQKENSDQTPAITGEQDLSEDFRLALDNIRRKRFSEAAKLLRSVVESETNPVNKINAYYWLGESYFNMKDYEKSIEAFSHVLASSGAAKADDALIMTAESYLKLGKTEQAKAHFNKLITSFPKSRYVARAKKMLQML